MYVYKLIDEYGNLLYIGKTEHLKNRIKQHISERNRIDWKTKIKTVMIAKCKNSVDLDIYETYYINKLKPIHNTSKVFNNIPTFELEELNFESYDFNFKKQRLIDYNEAVIGRFIKLYLKYKYKSFHREDMLKVLNIKERTSYATIKQMLEYEFVIKQGNLYKLNTDIIDEILI